MSAHTITLQLPFSLYDRYRQRARRTRRTVEAELLEAVSVAAPEAEDLAPDLVEAVSGLAEAKDAELWRVARGLFSAADSARLEALHLRRQAEGLSAEEEEITEGLVRRYEHAMLMRAHALKLLQERGHDVSGLVAGP